MPQMFVAFECASGFALFEVQQGEEISLELDAMQEAVQDMARFGKVVKLRSFLPFKSAEDALMCINDISEGILNDTLKNFLELNLPKVKAGKKSKWILGVSEQKLAQAISENLHYSCLSNETVQELMRGIRRHLPSFIPELKDTDLGKAQLGLGHAYSRSKVKFDANREDKMVIQSISLLDQLDKDLNTFAMRVREWYSWHFPELSKVVADNFLFAQCVKAVGDKSKLSEEHLPQLSEILGDDEQAQAVLDAARSSMGTDLSEVDMVNIQDFANRVVQLGLYRKQLHGYLQDKMHQVAPNLSSLIGEQVGARLIAHAGSLTSLAKYPASTVQILGAEKALFRALKTKGNTPKYGLIFHSSFIGRAAQKNKGRISRYLANKASIASRIDCFRDEPTDKFGEKLHGQVEERLKFYETGKAGGRNVAAMRDVMNELGEMDVDEPKKEKKEKKKDKKKKDKKRKAMDVDEEEGGSASELPPVEADDDAPLEPAKKKKKSKKDKSAGEETPKKKKKDKKDKTPKKKKAKE